MKRNVFVCVMIAFFGLSACMSDDEGLDRDSHAAERQYSLSSPSPQGLGTPGVLGRVLLGLGIAPSGPNGLGQTARSNTGASTALGITPQPSNGLSSSNLDLNVPIATLLQHSINFPAQIVCRFPRSG